MQAVQLVKEATEIHKEYDLIFMDVQMPNMDGLEATRLIRQAGFKRPIVALSAYSDDTNVRSCHDSGMDDFISKPIQITRLRLVLKTFCPSENIAPSSPGPNPGSSRERTTSRPMSSTSIVRSSSNPRSQQKETSTSKGDKPNPEYDDVSPLSSPIPPP